MDNSYTPELVQHLADCPGEIAYVHTLLEPEAFKRLLADVESELKKRGYEDVHWS